MKKAFPLFLFFLPFFASTQNFSEICENEITNGTVVDFELFNDTIYATGFFTQICGQPTNHIAKWTGSTWIPSEVNLTDPGHFIRNIDNKLFIAKYEESIDSNWVYVYDGLETKKFGTGVYLTTATNFSNLPHIYDVIKFNDKIIACGEFDKVGSQSISGIMRWNGNKWEDMQGGLSGNVPNTAPVMYPHQLMVFNSELYVAGNFRYAGDVEVNGIAKWDGNEWLAMGAGFNSTVYGIGVFDGEIYAGGDFTHSGTAPLNRIAKWNGSEWVSPGFGFIPINSNDYSFVHTIAEINNTLMVAGGIKEITYDDGTTENCSGIISFSQGEIDNFIGGVANNDIEAVIGTSGGNLLIGGGVFGIGYLGILNIPSNTNGSLDDRSINIYPNPFDDEINFETEINILALDLMDFSGRIILHLSDLVSNELELRHLEKGIYIIRMKTDAGFFVQKLIKS